MIWNFCIKRPVFTTVIFLILAIFGIYGYSDLPVRNFPDIDIPVVSVDVVLPGAEPEVVEREIIDPLEEEINTIEGLDTLQSTAREQVASITAEFNLERDIDIAAQDVRDAVERARRRLPSDAEAPIVRKLDMDAMPIVWVAFTGDERWDEVRMSDYVDQYVVNRLEPLPGVGRVMVGGDQQYAVRVVLDHEKLAAHRVTVQDVVSTIQANNVDIPSGRIEGKTREFMVKTLGRLDSPEAFNRLIVGQGLEGPVRLADVGEARDGVESDRRLSRFNRLPALGVGVIQQSGANTVEVAQQVVRRMEEIGPDLPEGLDYHIASDQSEFISESIRDLQVSILLATLLVFVVIMFFLRSLGATLITTVAIPTSLAVGMALIYAFGFSMNVITLLGLILVIGIVVDDAIVILESSYRHLEEGSSQKASARVGTTEVAFAAIANTLSLGAVFIPVAFTRGIIGRIFFEFGITVAVTIFASTFTALTLTPMLCSRFLRVSPSRGWVSRSIDRGLDRLGDFYNLVLNWSLKHRGMVVLLAVVVLVSGILFFLGLSTEFQPDIDAGEFILSFETAEGTTLRETDRYVTQIEEYLEKQAEVDNFFLLIGGMGAGEEVNSGMIIVGLVDRADRADHEQVIMDRYRNDLEQIPGGQIYTVQFGGPGGGEAPLQAVIQHEDLEELDRLQREITDWMRQQPEFVGVDADLSLERPQVEVRFDRDIAAQHGISVTEISQALRYLLSQPEIGEVEIGQQRYDLISEIASRGRTVPDLLEEIYLRDSAGELVALANLV